MKYRVKMSDVNEEIVKQFFEKNGFLVKINLIRQHLSFVNAVNVS